MFIKYSKAFIVLFVFPLSLFCQNNHGFAFDNYAGVYATLSNPANSVESKHRIHVNALSYNRWNVSDYGSVDLLNIEQNPNGFNGIDFEENTDKPKTDNLMVSNSDVLLPSVIWGFHEKHAVGLLLRSRVFTDYNGFDGNFWAQLNGSGVEGQNIGPSNFNHTVHHWSEVGLNYALVVFKTNYHFLKFGGTIKFLSGNGGVELRGKINENDLGAININSADITYVNSFSENVNPLEDSNAALFASSQLIFR